MAKPKYKLYLYNDNINSFNKIVRILTEVLDWTVYQSEQCALMAHENDKTVLKRGTYTELAKYCKAIKKARIAAAIQLDEGI